MTPGLRRNGSRESIGHTLLFTCFVTELAPTHFLNDPPLFVSSISQAEKLELEDNENKEQDVFGSAEGRYGAQVGSIPTHI